MGLFFNCLKDEQVVPCPACPALPFACLPACQHNARCLVVPSQSLSSLSSLSPSSRSLQFSIRPSPLPPLVFRIRGRPARTRRSVHPPPPPPPLLPPPLLLLLLSSCYGLCLHTSPHRQL